MPIATQTIKESFESFVADNELLRVFVDQIVEESFGCVYMFDGIMDCAIYLNEEDERFYHVHDISRDDFVKNGVPDFSTFESYETLEGLYADMLLMLEGDSK